MPRWRRRWQRWWQARHARTDRLVLTQRNVYILPTGAGALFAVLLLVLLLASINYQLNLGYLLTFVLAGAGLSSMLTTHATLRGLQLQLGAVEPVFAGEAARLPVTLQPAEGRSRAARHGIGLWPQQAGPAAPAWVDVDAGGAATLELAFTPPRRGRHALPGIVVETRFPFGLFRAWSHWRPAAPAWAWPRPESPAPPPPWTAPEHGAAQRLPRPGSDETEGVRPWRRGDALSQVLWKRSAQALAGGGELIARERSASAAVQRLLRWTDIPAPDPERRLARLAAWVLAAERAGTPYALQLPGVQVEPGLGPLQQRRCLDALAAWGDAGAAPEDAA